MKKITEVKNQNKKMHTRKSSTVVTLYVFQNFVAPRVEKKTR